MEVVDNETIDESNEMTNEYARSEENEEIVRLLELELDCFNHDYAESLLANDKFLKFVEYFEPFGKKHLDKNLTSIIVKKCKFCDILKEVVDPKIESSMTIKKHLEFSKLYPNTDESNLDIEGSVRKEKFTKLGKLFDEEKKKLESGFKIFCVGRLPKIKNFDPKRFHDLIRNKLEKRKEMEEKLVMEKEPVVSTEMVPPPPPPPIVQPSPVGKIQEIESKPLTEEDSNVMVPPPPPPSKTFDAVTPDQVSEPERSIFKIPDDREVKDDERDEDEDDDEEEEDDEIDDSNLLHSPLPKTPLLLPPKKLVTTDDEVEFPPKGQSQIGEFQNVKKRTSTPPKKEKQANSTLPKKESDRVSSAATRKYFKTRRTVNKDSVVVVKNTRSNIPIGNKISVQISPKTNQTPPPPPPPPQQPTQPQKQQLEKKKVENFNKIPPASTPTTTKTTTKRPSPLVRGVIQAKQLMPGSVTRIGPDGSGKIRTTTKPSPPTKQNSLPTRLIIGGSIPVKLSPQQFLVFQLRQQLQQLQQQQRTPTTPTTPTRNNNIMMNSVIHNNRVGEIYVPQKQVYCCVNGCPNILRNGNTNTPPPGPIICPYPDNSLREGYLGKGWNYSCSFHYKQDRQAIIAYYNRLEKMSVEERNKELGQRTRELREEMVRIENIIMEDRKIRLQVAMVQQQQQQKQKQQENAQIALPSGHIMKIDPNTYRQLLIQQQLQQRQAMLQFQQKQQQQQIQKKKEIGEVPKERVVVISSPPQQQNQQTQLQQPQQQQQMKKKMRRRRRKKRSESHENEVRRNIHHGENPKPFRYFLRRKLTRHYEDFGEVTESFPDIILMKKKAVKFVYQLRIILPNDPIHQQQQKQQQHSAFRFRLIDELGNDVVGDDGKQPGFSILNIMSVPENQQRQIVYVVDLSFEYSSHMYRKKTKKKKNLSRFRLDVQYRGVRVITFCRFEVLTQQNARYKRMLSNGTIKKVQISKRKKDSYNQVVVEEEEDDNDDEEEEETSKNQPRKKKRVKRVKVIPKKSVRVVPPWQTNLLKSRRESSVEVEEEEEEDKKEEVRNEESTIGVKRKREEEFVPFRRKKRKLDDQKEIEVIEID